MVEKFDEFLEEVKKDIRQEQLLTLWKQYGKLVISGAVTIIVLVAGYNSWSYYEQNKRLNMAEKLVTAQEYIAKGEGDKARGMLDSLTAESQRTYQPLALFQKAGLLLQEGPTYQPAEAMAIYHQLSGNAKLDSLWRDLASLLAVMAGMDQGGAKGEELVTLLDPLTSDNNPWRYFAREMKGVLLYRKGDKDQATEIFARLVQDNHTPSGISMRARLMVQVIATGAGK